jgi:UDP-N-acetylmuramate-alanine ligase
VAVLPIFAAGEPKDNSISEKSLAKDIGSTSGTKVYSFEKFPTPKQILDIHHPDHTIYLTVGAGICNQLAYQLRDLLNETQSKLNNTF